MNTHLTARGKRVYITSYGPFRGLRGTIQQVQTNAEEDNTLCFYLILLDVRKEPLWVEQTEVEFLDNVLDDLLREKVKNT